MSYRRGGRDQWSTNTCHTDLLSFSLMRRGSKFFFCYCFCSTPRAPSDISCCLWLMLAVTTARLQTKVLRILDCNITINLALIIACICVMFYIRSVWNEPFVHPSIHPSINPPSIPSSMSTLKFRNHFTNSALRNRPPHTHIFIVFMSLHK